jgi:hypothetical protein
VGTIALGEHACSGRGQRNGELRSEELAVGQTANAVRAEKA